MATPDRLRLVATEEAFATREYFAAIQAVGGSLWSDLDLEVMRLWSAENPRVPERFAEWLRRRRTQMLDVGAGRIEVMDEAGIDVFLLSLISPGVQLFDADTGTAMATLTNDALAEAIARHPGRLGGLASFAPQDPKRAAKEIERAIQTLKLNGLIVNSHTNGEYLDDPKFWPIFEAASALGAPIYIHPRNPPSEVRRMLSLHNGRRLTEVAWGFHMETGAHALRLLFGGVFEQFPDLKIVLGHLGEGVPFYFFRLDWAARNEPGPSPAERFKKNFYVTTSGAWEAPLCRPAFAYCHEVLGADRILFAADHPFADAKPAADFLRSVRLPREDLDKIAFRNAESLFRLTR